MVVWVANNLNANFVLKTGERRGPWGQHLHWHTHTQNLMGAGMPPAVTIAPPLILAIVLHLLPTCRR